MYVLLLFSEELRANRIEGIASEFMFSLHKLEEIQLKTAFQPSLLRVPLTVSLRRKVRFLGFRLVVFNHVKLGRTSRVIMLTLEPTEIGKLEGLEGFSAVKEVREVESSDVVPNDNIGIHFGNEITPSLKHFVLVFERKHLGADNMRTRIEREDIPYEWLWIP